MSDKMTHTPGPWTVLEPVNGFNARIFAAGNIYIGSIGHSDNIGGCNAPNARLIAAAPDMLEALEALLEASHPISRDKRSCDGRVKAKRLARAAIAKAKGA